MDEIDRRIVYLFRDRNLQLVVNARHRETRLETLRSGAPEIVDPRTAPPDELAARRARNESAPGPITTL